MRKRLLDKFMGNYGWVMIWLLATTYAIAGPHPYADTCQHPDPPVITGSAKEICRSQAVSLNATGCSGAVRWLDQSTGLTWIGRLQQTTTFQATCEQNGCVSNGSAGVTVQ